MGERSIIAVTDTLHNLRRISRILWVRVALISILSLAAALSATLADVFIPDAWKQRFSEETTLPILNVLASSLLAVATFSLGIMVSSHRALADQTTPRVHQILMEDTRTQTVIATFVGGFVYSLASIILFRAQVYGDGAAVVVFLTSVVVVLIIVLSLIRWIEHLSRIGSLNYALDQAELSAERVLTQLRERPRYGGAAYDTAPTGQGVATPIVANRSGFILRLQMADLQNCAKHDDCHVIIDVMPGDHVLEGTTVAHLIGKGNADTFIEHIVIGKKRSHDFDPRYALRALRESASKALSSGINDPGTAIEIIARLERLLWTAFAPKDEQPEPAFDRVYVHAVDRVELLATSFRQIAKDGRDTVEVIGSTVRAISHLSSRLSAPEAVQALMQEIDAYADDGLATDGEKDRYRAYRHTDNK